MISLVVVLRSFFKAVISGLRPPSAVYYLGTAVCRPQNKIRIDF